MGITGNRHLKLLEKTPLAENLVGLFSVSNGEWPHVVRLSLSGLIEQIVVVHSLSFCLRYSTSSLWIFSFTINERSSIE